MAAYYIKTNRIFSTLRRWAWLFVLLVAIGGLWYPKLGLLMIPLMVTLLVMGFFKGKYWCGNYCPHGSLFDGLIMSLSPNRPIPSFFKSKSLKILGFTWFSYMLVKRLIRVWMIFGTAPFIDKLGFIFVMNYFVVTMAGTLLAIFVSPRTWCNFCPMGTLEVMAYKVGKVTGINKQTDEKVTAARLEMCHKCAKCSRVCPMQLTPYLEFSEDTNQFENPACIRCSTCVENCPAGILSLNTEDDALQIQAQTNPAGYENRQRIEAEVERVRNLQDDVVEFTFRHIAPLQVDYAAGQFILVKIQDKPTIFRAYSISSYSQDGKQVSVTVKKVPNGYGTELIFRQFKVGDRVQLEGPMGNELIVDKSSEKVLLVAGGIGITPFVPVVRELVETDHQIKEFKLIYGANYAHEFLYDEEFTRFSSRTDHFEYIKVAAFDEHWEGKKGFVTDVMKELDLTGYKIYMCGPKPMINASINTLHAMGVQEEQIFYESA